MKKLYTIGTLLLFLLAVQPARAKVMLASPFTSHMVLQSDMKVPVWGVAEAGEVVTVTFAGQKESATADADGHWRLDLQPMKVSAESRTFTVTGSKTAQPIVLEDVLVGEVWLASGQSNMDFSLSKKVKYFAGVTNEEQEIAAANYPLIRMFIGTSVRTNVPQTRVGGEWQVCTPQTAPAFCAVGYFFARDLQREIKAPIGIVALAFGASTAEAWISREALAADAQLKPTLDRFDAAVDQFRTNPPPVVAAPRSEDVSATNATAGRRHRNGGPHNPVQDQHNATVLFNGMIQPVIPFAMRGALWYQGESIVGNKAGVLLYPHVMETLVKDWRSLWGEGDFPFYAVQLPALQNVSNNPMIREGQAQLTSLPNTAVAVTIDIGDPKDVHPHNKEPLGDRLTRLAMANTYGKAIEYSGPIYQSMKIEKATIRLAFTHPGGGLVAKDGPLKWFRIAGVDQKFVDATARIEGDTVIVSSPEVGAPVAVRYAWDNYPEGCNLYNAAGLPAAPFRTDRWDALTAIATEFTGK